MVIEQANACVYARYALAVWLARPEAFAAYDQWLFGSPRPPSVSEARAKAEQLVGMSALGGRLAEPRVEAKLRDAVELYRAVGGGKVPKLLLPQAVLWGRIPSVDELMRVLFDQLTISGIMPSASR